MKKILSAPKKISIMGRGKGKGGAADAHGRIAAFRPSLGLESALICVYTRSGLRRESTAGDHTPLDWISATAVLMPL